LDIANASWLALGFGLGLVHAFDADHVMALSVFAARGRGAADGIRAGLRWALGHGLVLIAFGLGLLFLGRALPPDLALLAERGVGLVMIVLGIWVWFELTRRRGHLHFHEHGDLPPHAHWHTHKAGHTKLQLHRDAHRHEHAPVFVGAMHGLAGSAPILAVLPAASRSPLLGVGYLIVFALGVGLAMAIVSGLMGHAAGRFGSRGEAGRLETLRALSASGSIILGVWMLALG